MGLVGRVVWLQCTGLYNATIVPFELLEPLHYTFHKEELVWGGGVPGDSEATRHSGCPTPWWRCAQGARLSLTCHRDHAAPLDAHWYTWSLHGDSTGKGTGGGGQ